MIATKDQERKAIEEIRKIVDNLGEYSYVGAAMDGVLEFAEDNIENGFVQSMKESVETAEKRAHELEEENEHLKATKEKLEEARACILPEEVRQKFYGIAFDKKIQSTSRSNDGSRKNGRSSGMWRKCQTGCDQIQSDDGRSKRMERYY